MGGGNRHAKVSQVMRSYVMEVDAISTNTSDCSKRALMTSQFLLLGVMYVAGDRTSE